MLSQQHEAGDGRGGRHSISSDDNNNNNNNNNRKKQSLLPQLGAGEGGGASRNIKQRASVQISSLSASAAANPKQSIMGGERRAIRTASMLTQRLYTASSTRERPHFVVRVGTAAAASRRNDVDTDDLSRMSNSLGESQSTVPHRALVSAPGGLYGISNRTRGTGLDNLAPPIMMSIEPSESSRVGTPDNMGSENSSMSPHFYQNQNPPGIAEAVSLFFWIQVILLSWTVWEKFYSISGY